MRILFLFLDGVGLGIHDPAINPFVRAAMPTLRALLGDQPLITSSAPYHGEQATLLALDATLGVPGPPQSATGQAVLLTGRNIPADLGYHYGPKPNASVAAYLTDGNTLPARLRERQKKAALLNAYPPRYFHGIQSGRRLYSAIPLAFTSAGFPLFTQDDLYAGRALSADFTGQGWKDMLGFADAPVHSPTEAGAHLAHVAQHYDFALFEYWASDYAGHKQDMTWAIEQLETFDGVLAGLLENWDDHGLILITSDHGNLEDLSTRRHTDAPVPALLIGNRHHRENFAHNLKDLTDIAPAIWSFLEQF